MTSRKTVAFSRHSANLFFHILTKCNLNCRHCYINPEQHGDSVLPIETIKKWMDAFSERSRATNIVFLGGEPTLHPDLAPAVKYARKLGFGSITIDTNGYLWHDILGRLTPDDVDYFSFSLDGATPQTNDRLRGEGSFDICLDGIRRAQKIGFNTSMIYTVSRANIHELGKMPALLTEIGIEKFFIQVIGLRGKSAAEDGLQTESEMMQVTREEWLDSVPKVAHEIADIGISVSYPKVFLEPDEPFECAGLVADNYFIFPNGRVYRCPLCEDFPIHGLEFVENTLVERPKLNETDFFQLDIPEGCVMNKLIQPQNLNYDTEGLPAYKIACCLLKEEVVPAPG